MIQKRETNKQKNPKHVGHLEGQEKGKFFNVRDVSTLHSQGIHYSAGRRMTSLTSWYVCLFPCL